MYKTIVKNIEKRINENLLNKDYLNRIGLSNKKEIIKIAKSHITPAKIKNLVDEEDFSAKRVLEFSMPALEKIYILYGGENDTFSNDMQIQNIYQVYVDSLYAKESYKTACFAAILTYMQILAGFLEYLPELENTRKGYYFEFLTEDELNNSPSAIEYKKFIQSYKKDKIYELMWIGMDATSFDFLGHVAGVHYIAMHIARQLYALEIPVDLGLISGAAAGHDIGKYGCKGEEIKRIPYLHYYYTDQWFKKHGINAIGHVAANHSTWDLELENLSVESLLLIYADFRVKSDGKYDNGFERIKYYSIQESFDVILSKLDNVDDAKEKRYRKVYDKLKDFEDYLLNLGVNTDLKNENVTVREHKNPAILSSSDTIQLLKYMAIEHNIRLMSVLEQNDAFGAMLEDARSEKDWRNTRSYLNAFEEYFTYMTPWQKEMTLEFLYEQLVNKEGDIRRQAAVLMGKIIVAFNVEYRKELPEGAAPSTYHITGLDLWETYISRMFTHDYKIVEQQRRWIGFALKRLVETVFNYCKESEKQIYLSIFIKKYEMRDCDEVTRFALLDSMRMVPFKDLNQSDRDILLDFIYHMANDENLEIQAAVIMAIRHIFKEMKTDSCFNKNIIKVLDKMSFSDETGIRYVARSIKKGISPGKIGDRDFILNLNDISEIFLKNMKIATPWMVKEINIRLLSDYLMTNPRANTLQIATHFSNLLKGSERITVRHTAGKALLRTAKYLSREQRNEIAIELNKGLETGEYEFSKYIPEYLGQFVLFLNPSELDEFLLEIKKFINSNNERVVCVALNTIGIMLKYYSRYKISFGDIETNDVFECRRKEMIGILLGGMAHYNSSVSQEAFLVISKEIFESEVVSEDEKLLIFKMIYRKIATILPTQEKNQLSFLNNASSLNHIYRFISNYIFNNKSFNIQEQENVVFFPGTFDPFSLSHKEIARMLRDKGFIVYLAIDEFSWSKKTQPRMIRRQIMSMSIAGEENMYIFPEDIPVNIANPKDLIRLREVFKDKKLYLAAGADVVKNASSYKVPATFGSVHSLNHIVFKRTGVEVNCHELITGEILEMELPERLTDVSSTRIRDYIDQNRDISKLVDEVVQNYIYEYQLYLREPEFKPIMGGERVDMEIYDVCSKELAETIKMEIFKKYGREDELVEKIFGSGAVIMVDREEDDKLLGAAIFRDITTAELYEEFKNTEISNYIREKASGKILLLQGIYTIGNSDIKEREQLLLTEALANAVAKDYTYCVYSPRTDYARPKKEDFLIRQGFVSISAEDYTRRIFVVDMKKPVILFKNMITVLKAPFNQSEQIISVINKTHSKLQMAMTGLYPGNLVISFDSAVMYNRMISLITKANKVPVHPLKERKLGEYMCVPFGKILRGVAVPNTVTKTLHTEKVFAPDLKSYEITEYPNYLSLEDQARTIKSFNRKVILVDDILNKGYRIRKLDPIFKEENVDVDRLVIGLISGRGKDLMTIQNRRVESVYYLPTLRAWFVESTMYPFVGGDLVDRDDKMRANLLSSINLILPYAHPAFVGDADREALYNLSKVCLENARDILEALEREYQERFGRKLTLKRLSEAIISPCSPDRGPHFEIDYHLSASTYLKSDIEKLERLEKLMI